MPLFWLGLVTGASEINWEGSCTLSEKEKRNQSMSQRKRKQSVNKALNFLFVL